MKHRFASFTLFEMVAAVAMAAAPGIEAGGREPGVSDPTPATADTRLPPPDFTSGQQLVAEAARYVASEPAISAELRYKIDAFGHSLVGSGSYLQFGASPEKLVRLELRMQIGDKQAIVQEIRGADSYWVRRDMPPTPPSLGVVDLKKFRQALVQSAEPSTSDVLPRGDWIMLGGLSRLLASLEQNFVFDKPRAEELRFNAAEGKALVRLPIWVVSGHWNPDRLAALVGREAGKSSALPEQLPDRVELVLGRTGDILRLFPYRVSYWHTPTIRHGKKEVASGQPHELLTLELFNVSRKPIDAHEFDYQPGDQEVQNLTQFYAQRYGGETKLR